MNKAIRSQMLFWLFVWVLKGQGQTFQWVSTEPNQSYITRTDIVTHDNSGNVFAAGEMNNGGIFIAKYDSVGQKLWENQYVSSNQNGGGGSLGGGSLCVDNTGNLFVSIGVADLVVNGTTYTSNNGPPALFIKFDPGGNIVWLKRIGYGMMMAKRTDLNDNIAVCGYFTGTFSNNGVTMTADAGGSYYIGRFNTSGDCIWAINNEGSNRQPVCNNICGRMNFRGEIMQTSVTLGKGQKQVTFYASNGYGYIASYQANGSLAWAAQVTSMALVTDNLGNTYSMEPDLSDLAHGSNKNAYLVKYDAAGNILWKRTHLYIDNWYKFEMNTDADGNLYATGGFANYMTLDSAYFPANGSTCAFVSKLDTGGSVSWVSVSAGGSAGGKDITIDPLKRIYVLGDISGSGTFGNVTAQEPTGGIFLARLANDRSSVFIKEFSAGELVNIYPNPAHTTLNIKIAEPDYVSITIYDATGNVAYKSNQAFYPKASAKMINVQNYSKGIYFIEVDFLKAKKKCCKKIMLQ